MCPPGWQYITSHYPATTQPLAAVQQVSTAGQSGEVFTLDTVLWRINEKNIYFDSFLIIKYWRAHAKFHEIMRCRSAIHDRYQNIFKEKNGLGDNLYLSFLDIKISRDQPLQHSTIWIQFCSCRLYRESKKVSYWKNGHITTFKLIQKAKAGVVLEFRIFATI